MSRAERHTGEETRIPPDPKRILSESLMRDTRWRPLFPKRPPLWRRLLARRGSSPSG
ncbi:MAG TPA: hypothetical protein VF520_14845 [Thermoleophilaceae bacterium]